MVEVGSVGEINPSQTTISVRRVEAQAWERVHLSLLLHLVMRDIDKVKDNTSAPEM